MRTIGEIPHPKCRITLFQWNGKYLIKLEQGSLEQTYKVPDTEVTSDDDIIKMLDEEFMDKALTRFKEMGRDLRHALDKV